MWIAKKPFNDYQKGDEVTEADVKKYGVTYCTKSGETETAETETGEVTGTAKASDNLEDHKMPELIERAKELEVPTPFGITKEQLLADVRAKIKELEA